MTAAWWAEAAQSWARDVGLTVRIEQHRLSARASREAGAWWKNGDVWCVELEDGWFASFSGECSPPLRKSFSWGYHLLRAERTDTWERSLCLAAEDALVRPLHELWQTLGRSGRLPGQGTDSLAADEINPGRFLVLQVRNAGVHATATGENWRDALDAVLAAAAPDSQRVWLAGHDPRFSSMVIVFVPGIDESVDDDESLDPASDAPDAWASLRRCVERLLDMVAADALLSCDAAVGAVASGPGDVDAGLKSAIATWRTRPWTLHPDRVTLWGEHPWTQWLLALSPEQSAWLLDTVSLPGRGGGELESDLEETLRGMLDANLNISEAARLLFLHRNTLTHRIDRIYEQTGYDVRRFVDAAALSFLVALRRRQADD